MEKTVYLCAECEQFLDQPVCPKCGRPAAPISRKVADGILWKVNMERVYKWIEADRIIPEVD